MKRDLYNKVNKKYQHTKKLSVMLRTKFFFGMITLMLGTNIFLTNCTFQQKGNVGNSLGKNDKEKEKPENIAYEIPKILPPLKGIDVPFKTYKVEGNKEQKIVIEETGTIINIPANAFLDKDGKVVQSKVKVSFREFYNPLDFYLAGIPMNYSENGIEKAFESGGMVEINASTNNTQVFVNKENKIKVDVLSWTKSKDFNLYDLDSETGKWVDKGKDKIEVISKSDALDSYSEFPSPPKVATVASFKIKDDTKLFPEIEAG
jgi:hypothetical protein